MGNDYLPPLVSTFASHTDAGLHLVRETHVYSGALPAQRPGCRRETTRGVDHAGRPYTRVVDTEEAWKD